MLLKGFTLRLVWTIGSSYPKVGVGQIFELYLEYCNYEDFQLKRRTRTVFKRYLEYFNSYVHFSKLKRKT